MFNSFEFCLPTKGLNVPDGPDWLHEVKYDGYRLRLERDGDRVRLITRGGYNWTDRYPWIGPRGNAVQHPTFMIYSGSPMSAPIYRMLIRQCTSSL